MRVLVVASEVPPVRSGVARAVGRLAEGAVAAGIDVETRSYVDGRVIVRDQLRLSTLGLALRNRDLESFDLVHLHGPAPSVSDVLLLRHRLGRLGAGVRWPPLIYTHHFTVWGEADVLGPAYRAYDAVARRLARSADVIVTTTESYRDRLATPGGPPVEVVPWGVDPPEQPPPPRGVHTDPLRVLVVGQMRRYKGHLVALDAVRGREEFRLTLAGSGELEREIIQAASSVPNVDVVVGPSDDELERLYRDHDVIALPSTNVSEAFGIVLVEGMARGCVPVASDLPGVRDVASATGLVAAPGDAVALARVLAMLADDRHDLARRSAASIRHGAELSWDAAVAAHVRLYRRLAAGG